MKDHIAPLHSWLIEPLPAEMSAAVDRLRRAPDVQQVSLMPDAHMAAEICVGTVFSTHQFLYPQAVGGDIGCGMLAIGFDVSVSILSDGKIAGELLASLAKAIPASRHHRSAVVPLPEVVELNPLTDRSLNQFLKDEGILQFGTLGGGNHFIELQFDDADGLWLMIHSGSRVMGQAIRDHHLARATSVGSRLRVLDAQTDQGQAYLYDVSWARTFAWENRLIMANRVSTILHQLIGANQIGETLIHIDHNHVQQETHFGNSCWVHRKGAMPADLKQPGVIPGSMGTDSYHVVGRGAADSLRSSAHGAGRKMSREQARKTIATHDLTRQMAGIWFDYRKADKLREEAPQAYKDVRAVMRAQNDLVKIVRRLRPILNYKGN